MKIFIFTYTNYIYFKERKLIDIHTCGTADLFDGAESKRENPFTNQYF